MDTHIAGEWSRLVGSCTVAFVLYPKGGLGIQQTVQLKKNNKGSKKHCESDQSRAM